MSTATRYHKSYQYIRVGRVPQLSLYFCFRLIGIDPQSNNNLVSRQEIFVMLEKTIPSVYYRQLLIGSQHIGALNRAVLVFLGIGAP